MGLPFTSGLERPQETLIAEALVARLGLLGQSQGLFLRHVGESPSMPSRLTGEAWDQMLQKMSGQAPAVFVVIDGSRPIARGMIQHRNLWQREFDVVIAVFSSHRRDCVNGRLNPDVVSRRGPRADPGIRAICELVDTLLLGWPLDVPTVYEMEPAERGTRTAYAGTQGTLREMHYHVRADRHRKPWPDVDTYLSAIHTVYGPTLEMETPLS